MLLQTAPADTTSYMLMGFVWSSGPSGCTCSACMCARATWRRTWPCWPRRNPRASTA